MTEEWRSVVGYEGLYEVSDQGRVRSLDREVWNPRGFVANRRGVTLRPAPNHGGYPLVTLYSGGRTRKTIQVHKLVLEAFVAPKPPGTEARHRDGNPENNVPSNLMWSTHSKNIKDQIRHGTHNMGSRTHCKRGHEFTPENTAQYGHSRVCRTCRRAINLAGYHRNKTLKEVTR